MAQCKKKVDYGEHIDRISELPSNVIDILLQHVPIEELIKTSVLSKKWRYMWTSVPILHFSDNFFRKFYHLSYHETSRIIMKVLSLYTGPIDEFALSIPVDFALSINSENPSEYRVKITRWLDDWILLLSRKGLKKLAISVPFTRLDQTPSHIFSCQELTYLDLEGLNLSSAPNFYGFKRLLSLRLISVTFESGVLESLMSGCSVLENVTIRGCFGFEHVTVCSPFLKYLFIGSMDYNIKSICLKKTQRGRVSDLMKVLPKIEKLILRGSCIKAFSANSPQVLLETLNTLVYLELTKAKFSVIISLLESCPNLKQLVIESRERNYGKYKPEVILKELDYKDCNFSQLQDVYITVNTVYKDSTIYKDALNLIRFVLAKSSSLSILQFKVGLSLSKSSPTLLSISSDLLQMKRASPTAEVKFFYDA